MPNINQFKTKEEYREWYRNYRLKNRLKLKVYQQKFIRQWREKNGTLKDNVRHIVYNALKKGKIKKGKCFFKDKYCVKRIEAHHPDYSNPLDVIWVCAVHHKIYHKKVGITQNTFSKFKTRYTK